MLKPLFLLLFIFLVATPLCGEQRSQSASPEEHFQSGLAASQGQRWKDAETEFRAVLAEQPRSAEAHYKLGVVLVNLERKVDALAEFGQALTLKPDYADAIFNIGVVLASLGRREEASTKFRRYMELAPKDADGPFNLAMQLSELSQDNEAIVACQQALALNPRHERAWLLLSWEFTHVGRSSEGADAARKALEVKKDYSEAYYNLAIALSKMGDWSGAVGAFDGVTRLVPYSSPLHALAVFGRAVTRLTLWRGAEAAKEADYYLRLSSSKESASEMIAVGYFGRFLNEGERAASSYLASKIGSKQLIREEPDCKSPYLLVAYLRGKCGQDQVLHSQEPAARAVVGMKLLLDGHRKEAEMVLEPNASMANYFSRLSTAVLKKATEEKKTG